MTRLVLRRRIPALLTGACLVASVAACELSPEQRYDIASRDLRSGSLEVEDQQDAIADLYKAAKAGHVPAAVELGDLAAEGKIVERDIPTAANWYRFAYQRGSVEASVKLAMLALDHPDEVGVDPSDLKPVLQQAVDNDTDGIVTKRVAELYEEGFFGSPDKATAAGYYLKSAEMGRPAAWFQYGDIVADKANGDLFDPEAAVRAYEKAADGGISAAYTRLGDIYAEGLGPIPQDMPRAMAVYEQGEAQGQALSAWNLAVIYADEEGDYYDPILARKKFAAIADELPAAYYRLGRLYLSEPDADEAAALQAFKKGAAADQAASAFMLAKHYQDEGNKDLARKYYRQALDGGISAAEDKLAELRE